MKRINLMTVAGARPNFMKIAPLADEIGLRKEIGHFLVHTGQHYDTNLSHLFFEQLGIPEPDINLEVGSGSHAVQTAEIMKAFEPVLFEQQPDCVIVVGDVNSTIACTLVAVKLGVPVAHVEAGLRSFDRTMPEEINRVLTDRIADYLFVTEQSGMDNLAAEGVSEDKMFFTGNVMIDTLLKHLDKAKTLDTMARFGVRHNEFGLVTLHRPSNVDNVSTLQGILDALARISQDYDLILPLHPRTAASVDKFGLRDKLNSIGRMKAIDPLGYLEFLNLMSNARFVLTDSGGIQEETTILGIPCFTLRENTERPVTITHGTNTLTGPEPARILEAFSQLDAKPQPDCRPPLWDGKAAGRIVDILAEKLQ